ncbi:cytidine deaminase-like protein [Sodiomyces alkalinus F11]|uniref:Cytidine deaminase-like protein n=1 Tax=Sodiomyces alkalinus (strain CBS 110278 / VKM F-3762 / F11) TaxID=1314773 RepID=A0A3N2PQ25_SODAK|nr:cytidine deaminase-like protein [Sodiomyces alkalinus F11]ROT36613.1 cytidine deaminase-like protein [Sodiomyces alkalinus F11]
MASSPDTAPQISPGDHRAYMQYALSLAKQSPPKPSNYRVGAILVDRSTNVVLSTGYTLELEGNTHAEQCCFAKLAERHGVAEEQLADAMANASPRSLVLYTTMEPCSQRMSGNLPCTQRILRLRPLVSSVYVGVKEPEKFVSENTGRKALGDAGIEFVHVEGLEREILEVATAGHVK